MFLSSDSYVCDKRHNKNGHQSSEANTSQSVQHEIGIVSPLILTKGPQGIRKDKNSRTIERRRSKGLFA